MKRAFPFLFGLLVLSSAPVMAMDDGFGDPFTAQAPAALDDTAYDDPVADDVSAIEPASGDGGEADNASSAESDLLASPETPPIPGMDHGDHHNGPVLVVPHPAQE